jgi:hypothetical protein
MTLVEEDLLAALKELYESSKVMTDGKRTTGEEMNRYYQAQAWAERLIRLHDFEESLGAIDHNRNDSIIK